VDRGGVVLVADGADLQPVEVVEQVDGAEVRQSGEAGVRQRLQHRGADLEQLGVKREGLHRRPPLKGQ
jgi:hypothetical protein